MVAVGSAFLTVTECGTPAGPGVGGSVVWLRGEHDSFTMAAVSDTIARAIALDGPAIVIDVSEVEFMSTAIVGVIVRASTRLRRQSRALTLRAPSSCVLRAFDSCGCADLLDANLVPALRRIDHPSPSGGAVEQARSRLVVDREGFSAVNGGELAEARVERG